MATSSNEHEADPNIPINVGETATERRLRLECKRHLEKKMFQLANFYFVFQGVVFTAFYSVPSHLKCRYKWMPMILSGLAACLNLAALGNIAERYTKALADDEEPLTYANCFCILCRRFCRWLTVMINMIATFCFLAVMLIGCWRLSCDPESPK